MAWACNTTLNTILQVHVVVIIAESCLFKTPAATVLELGRDLPEVPLLGHPLEGWCTISSIYFEGVEGGPSTNDNSGASLPEANPLSDFLVLIDGLSLLEVQCWIGVHRGGLHEGLELITRMSGCTLDTEDALDGLFPQDWETESLGNMGELLVLSPLDIILRSLIVIVVMSVGAVSKVSLVVDLLSL